MTNENRRTGYYESALHENFRNAETSSAETGQEGREVFGLADSVSGKRIIQPFNDSERMKAMAEANVEPLTQQLNELVAGLPGVAVHNARAKEPVRMGAKLKRGRRADTLTDYLGGRIVVDDPRMFDETVRVLAQRYKIVEADDFLDNARESGYRATHMQIVLDNGMTAEIQIMPSDILDVYSVGHPKYEKWRDKDTYSEEELNQQEVDKAWARETYAEAYGRWLRRAGSKSTWPENH